MLKNVKKSIKSTEKRLFWGTPSGSRPAFACRPALRSRQNHFFFVRFLLISAVKSLKKLWNEQKCSKPAEKNVSTSFSVLQAPKSWSKYTAYALTSFLWTFEMLALILIIIIVINFDKHLNFSNNQLYGQGSQKIIKLCRSEDLRGGAFSIRQHKP